MTLFGRELLSGEDEHKHPDCSMQHRKCTETVCRSAHRVSHQASIAQGSHKVKFQATLVCQQVMRDQQVLNCASKHALGKLCGVSSGC